jgi:hypothetical protein
MIVTANNILPFRIILIMELVVSIQADLQAVTERLLQLLQQCASNDFAKKPNTQGWSFAEVAEHLLIINKNLAYVLKADGAAPDRAPDKKLPVIKEALSDRSTKLVAPENVRPTGTVHNQQELISGLQHYTQVLKQVITEKELNELCTQYPHPRLGRLTRLEWIYFIIYHMERHCLQLEEMVAKASTNV